MTSPASNVAYVAAGSCAVASDGPPAQLLSGQFGLVLQLSLVPIIAVLHAV